MVAGASKCDSTGCFRGTSRFLCCAGSTGPRLEKLLGLQWIHIDLAGRKVRIEKSLCHGRLDLSKTQRSMRTIYIGETLANMLKDHFERTCQKEPEVFVSCYKDGSPRNPDVLGKDVLYSILDGLRIPRGSGASGFHRFEHSAADMTANVYTHASDESERETALAIERAIGGDLFPKLFLTGGRAGNISVNYMRRLC